MNWLEMLRIKGGEWMTLLISLLRGVVPIRVGSGQKLSTYYLYRDNIESNRDSRQLLES